LGQKDLKDLVLIGHVIRPHGLTGLLRVVSYAQSTETFLLAGSVFLSMDKKEFFEDKVVSAKPHGSVCILKLSHIDSIDQAEKYKGAEILIKKESLLKEDGDEFFWYELIGLDVYLLSGQYLGVLKNIFTTGGNDVYVVEGQEKEFLIPATQQVVKEINIGDKKMIISPVKGLLDI
jgi:16S rRNA processing protein RimM